MSNYSPIKNNQEMLKVICKDMKSLTNDVKCIKEMLSVITKNINDSVKVEIIEDKPSPMEEDKPQTQTELYTSKSWFW
jgi:hypothetical protein